MKLRCKQGDLAWVTYDEDSCAANIGRLVRVSGPVWLSRQYGGKPTWLIFPVDRRVWSVLDRCRIPDDCIDEKRYPLFMARAVLKELIESLQSTGSVSS